MRKKEMSAFLRARRGALQPEDVGLPAGGRRRTPGLRREEVAQLCNISTTWYTWLEQGRVDGVSVLVLNAIAKALLMGQAQREYLFDLAGRSPSAEVAPKANLPSPLQRMIQTLPYPAYVLAPYGDAIEWNEPAATLFVGWLGEKDQDRNLLRYMFLNPQAHLLVPDWEERARRVVAEFRADSAHVDDDGLLAKMVADLGTQSSNFVRLWNLTDVSLREGGLREFSHPTLGTLCFEQISFRPGGSGDWRLTILIPERKSDG